MMMEAETKTLEKKAIIYIGSKGKLKRPKPYWPRMGALYDVHEYQESTKLLICNTHLMWLVCGITEDFLPKFCFLALAMLALQEAAECYLVHLLRILTCVQCMLGM